MNDMRNRISLVCKNIEGTRRAAFSLLVAAIVTVVSFSGLEVVMADDDMPQPANPSWTFDSPTSTDDQDSSIDYIPSISDDVEVNSPSGSNSVLTIDSPSSTDDSQSISDSGTVDLTSGSDILTGGPSSSTDDSQSNLDIISGGSSSDSDSQSVSDNINGGSSSGSESDSGTGGSSSGSDSELTPEEANPVFAND